MPPTDVFLAHAVKGCDVKPSGSRKKTRGIDPTVSSLLVSSFPLFSNESDAMAGNCRIWNWPCCHATKKIPDSAHTLRAWMSENPVFVEVTHLLFLKRIRGLASWCWFQFGAGGVISTGSAGAPAVFPLSPLHNRFELFRTRRMQRHPARTRGNFS